MQSCSQKHDPIPTRQALLVDPQSTAHALSQFRLSVQLWTADNFSRSNKLAQFRSKTECTLDENIYLSFIAANSTSVAIKHPYHCSRLSASRGMSLPTCRPLNYSNPVSEKPDPTVSPLLTGCWQELVHSHTAVLVADGPSARECNLTNAQISKSTHFVLCLL
jgi:hypothetical protein